MGHHGITRHFLLLLLDCLRRYGLRSSMAVADRVWAIGLWRRRLEYLCTCLGGSGFEAATLDG